MLLELHEILRSMRLFKFVSFQTRHPIELNMSGSAATLVCYNLNPRSPCVLDDDVHIGRLVCRLLVANGFTSQQFADPIPFLNAVKASSPALIVLDLSLGQTDAVEIIRKLEVLKFTSRVLHKPSACRNRFTAAS